MDYKWYISGIFPANWGMDYATDPTFYGNHFNNHWLDVVEDFLPLNLSHSILLMVQKSGDHQLIWRIYHYLRRVKGTIPGGCLGFLNHQQ